MKKLFYCIGFFLSLNVALAQVKAKPTPVKAKPISAKKDSSIVKADSLKPSGDSLRKVPAKKVITKDEAELKGDKKSKEDTTDLSYAEEYRQSAVQFSFGIRGGLGFGNMSLLGITPVRINQDPVNGGLPLRDSKNLLIKDGLQLNSAYSIGYSGGIFIRMTRGSFFFQPEILYSIKGGSFDIKDGLSGNFKQIDTKLAHIDVPLLFGIRFRQARIFVGPVLNFPMNIDNSLSEALQTYINPKTDFKSEILSRPIVNLHAGIGFELNHFIMDFRYEVGLSDVVNYGVGSSSNPSTFSFKSNVIMLSIGYLLK
jgi:Outer membrane protein beta-barrel domain